MGVMLVPVRAGKKCELPTVNDVRMVHGMEPLPVLKGMLPIDVSNVSVGFLELLRHRIVDWEDKYTMEFKESDGMK